MTYIIVIGITLVLLGLLVWLAVRATQTGEEPPTVIPLSDASPRFERRLCRCGALLRAIVNAQPACPVCLQRGGLIPIAQDDAEAYKQGQRGRSLKWQRNENPYAGKKQYFRYAAQWFRGYDEAA